MVLLESHVASVTWLPCALLVDAEHVVNLPECGQPIPEFGFVGERIHPDLAVRLSRLDLRPPRHGQLVDMEFDNFLVVTAPAIIPPIGSLAPASVVIPFLVWRIFYRDGQRIPTDLLIFKNPPRLLRFSLIHEGDAGAPRG